MNTYSAQAALFFSEKPKILIIFEVIFKKKLHDNLQTIPEKLAFSTFKKLTMAKNGNFLKKVRFWTVFGVFSSQDVFFGILYKPKNFFFNTFRMVTLVFHDFLECRLTPLTGQSLSTESRQHIDEKN